VARPESGASLDEEREGGVARHLVGEPRVRRRDAALREEQVREVLVAEALHGVGVRQQHEGAELVAGAGEDRLVEIGERDDQANVVRVDEAPQRRHVIGVVDPWDELVAIGVVERRGERVRVGRDRRRARAAERADDVDALSGAREENRRHEREPSPRAP
jgi:hypothetical protein